MNGIYVKRQLFFVMVMAVCASGDAHGAAQAKRAIGISAIVNKTDDKEFILRKAAMTREGRLRVEREAIYFYSQLEGYRGIDSTSYPKLLPIRLEATSNNWEQGINIQTKDDASSVTFWYAAQNNAMEGANNLLPASDMGKAVNCRLAPLIGKGPFTMIIYDVTVDGVAFIDSLLYRVLTKTDISTTTKGLAANRLITSQVADYAAALSEEKLASLLQLVDKLMVGEDTSQDILALFKPRERAPEELRREELLDKQYEWALNEHRRSWGDPGSADVVELAAEYILAYQDEIRAAKPEIKQEVSDLIKEVKRLKELSQEERKQKEVRQRAREIIKLLQAKIGS